MPIDAATEWLMERRGGALAYFTWRLAVAAHAASLALLAFNVARGCGV